MFTSGRGQRSTKLGPEWMPYTILGDRNWKDYEVSADVYVNTMVGRIMGRIIATGSGYGCKQADII